MVPNHAQSTSGFRKGHCAVRDETALEIEQVARKARESSSHCFKARCTRRDMRGPIEQRKQFGQTLEKRLRIWNFCTRDRRNPKDNDRLSGKGARARIGKALPKRDVQRRNARHQCLPGRIAPSMPHGRNGVACLTKRLVDSPALPASHNWASPRCVRQECKAVRASRHRPNHCSPRLDQREPLHHAARCGAASVSSKSERKAAGIKRGEPETACNPRVTLAPHFHLNWRRTGRRGSDHPG